MFSGFFLRIQGFLVGQLGPACNSTGPHQAVTKDDPLKELSEEQELRVFRAWLIRENGEQTSFINTRRFREERQDHHSVLQYILCTF
jgi:hypothetical protein